ncbi:gastrula zinc finger protein XlCGF49.1-like [Stegodyphus dumicola]|uniref:gastrula zinc finger protein XlCGF49.1-like n=1 Tax=Stegodyphus dumicola TaxID=202533 RepID=UPI0015B0B6EB|nr:gastrula zinc finger protein XlCGF49.1-like [Stegodyphus dumicola]
MAQNSSSEITDTEISHLEKNVNNLFSREILLDKYVVNSFYDSQHDVLLNIEDTQESDICERDVNNVKAKTLSTSDFVKQKPFVCLLCDKRFGSKSAQAKHNKKQHTVRKLPECLICGRHFVENFVLKQHYLTHSGEKPHECDVCKRGFNSKYNLKRHYMLHSEVKTNYTVEKKFACDLCDKMFCTKSALYRHCLNHTGDKRYACDMCGKSFHQKSDVKRHYTCHTGDKPYECKNCDKRFTKKDSLMRHYKRHTHKAHM